MDADLGAGETGTATSKPAGNGALGKRVARGPEQEGFSWRNVARPERICLWGWALVPALVGLGS